MRRAQVPAPLLMRGNASEFIFLFDGESMKNPCHQSKAILIILLIIAPPPLESQLYYLKDWYNMFQFLRDPAAGQHTQQMLEYRYKFLLEEGGQFMAYYMKSNISNIGHMYLLKLHYDKYYREFLSLSKRMSYVNGLHAACSLLKIRFEIAREFSAERTPDFKTVEIDCPAESNDVMLYLEEYEEFIQEANFIMFSQYVFTNANRIKQRLNELQQSNFKANLRDQIRIDCFDLFGLSRLTQLREMYPQYFSRILQLDDEALLWWNYLHYFSAKTMLGRWRNKQAAEYFLYLEWEAINSDEQPADNGWTASTFWKPFLHDYWEGEQFLRQLASSAPQIQKEGWERIFLFPEEYAREQLERRPSTLEAARVCTLETQRKYNAAMADKQNNTKTHKKELDKFWDECLRMRLKKEHKAENMRGQKEMHARKLVDFLAFHAKKDALKEAIDEMEENWLKRLIGISKRQLYSRVKQKAESKSNKENKTENENETDEPSSSETNSEGIQPALLTNKIEEDIKKESEKVTVIASEVHENTAKQVTNEADKQQPVLENEKNEFRTRKESNEKMLQVQTNVDEMSKDLLKIKRVLISHDNTAEQTRRNHLSNSAKKSPTPKEMAELNACSQQRFVEASKKQHEVASVKKPTKKTAPLASQKGVEAGVDAREKIITVEKTETLLSMELYELSKAYLEQTSEDALSAAYQIGSQPSLMTSPSSSSPFPSNHSSSGALTPLLVQPSPRTTMRSLSEDLSSGAMSPPLIAASPNISMPAGTSASNQPSPPGGIPPWEPPAKLLLPNEPSSSGTRTPTPPLSTDESSPSELASVHQQQLTTTPTSNFEDYLEKIYALFFEQKQLGKGHHHLLLLLHICVITRAIDGKFRAVLALYKAGIFGEVDETKTTLKELDSSWRRFKRMAIFGAKIRTDMPLKEATLKLETLLGKMARFYFAMGKMPMDLPSKQEVGVIQMMAQGMETPIEKKIEADSVAEKLGLTLTHLHFQFFSLIIARKTSFLDMDDQQAQQMSPLECFGCIDKFTDPEGNIKLTFFRHLHELMGLEEEQGGVGFLETVQKLEANIKAFRTVLRQQELDRCLENELKILRKTGKLPANFDNKKWLNPEFYEHIKAQDFSMENIFVKKREENLIAFLEEKYKIDENLEKQKEEAKSWLAQQVKNWLTKVSALNGKGYGDFTLIVGGSSLLGTDSSNSDLDIIIMLPKLCLDEPITKACAIHDYIFGKKDEHSLYSHLLASLQREEHNSTHFYYLNAIPSAWVPLIELHRRGVEIDLMVALTPFEVIQPNWSLENSDDPLMVGYNLTLLDWWIKTMIVMVMERYLKSIRILNGYRIAYRVKYFLLDSQRESCTNLMRAIKLWAKERHIYSNVFGYLSGTIVTILSTKICMVYQSQNLTKLLEHFFFMYINWGWPRPVLLEPLTKASQADLLKPIGAWQPISRLNSDEKTGDGGDAMPVISSQFPEQNTAYNVNRHTLQIIQKEMRRAYDILNRASKMDYVSVRSLFKELDYRKEFNYFFLVFCLVERDTGTNADSTCGYLKTRIRSELASWAQTATVGKIKLKDHLREYHTLSGFEEKGNCQVDSGKKLCTVWLVGLNFIDDGLDEKQQEIFANNFNYYLAKYDGKLYKLKSIFVKQANIGLDEKLQEILTKTDDSSNDSDNMDETKGPSSQQEHNQFLSDEDFVNDVRPTNSPIMEQQHPQQWLTPAQQHQLLALYERQFAFYQHQLYLQEIIFLEELHHQQDQQNLQQFIPHITQQKQQYTPTGYEFVHHPSLLYPVIYYNLPMPQPPPLNNSRRKKEYYYVPKNGVKTRRWVPKSHVPNQPQPSH